MATWRDALGRRARALAGSPEYLRASADAARYEATYGLTLAVAPGIESFAHEQLRLRRETMAGLTLTRVASRKPNR